MAIEQSVLPLELEKLGEERAAGVVEWRAVQKENERERRRLRDRERRQSMSVEEREKHLERRRKNYQLRRQRAAAAAAANAKQEQVNFTPQIAAEAESSVRSETLALPGPYRYPRVLRLTQIKRLIRLLNCSSEKPYLGSQENAADTINAERTVPNGIPRKGIRLVHVKNLIRMLNSQIRTTAEQNDSDNMKEGEGEGGRGEVEDSSNMQRENKEGSDERGLWNENEKTIEAIDENEQICADGMCCL